MKNSKSAFVTELPSFNMTRSKLHEKEVGLRGRGMKNEVLYFVLGWNKRRDLFVQWNDG